MTEADPFDEGVPRNGKGAPLIIPRKRDGTPNAKGKPKAYTRASTFAKALSTGSGLTTWKVRHAVVGIAISPALAKMVAALGPNPDDYTPQQKRDLDDIIERAHDRSGGNDKADYGTAVHSLTEPGNDGVIVDNVMRSDVAAYELALDAGKLEAIDSERFVVNDELEVAGTYDHRYRVTETFTVELNGKPVELAAGTVLIGDKKTGSLHFEEHVIQLAVYARAKLYDHTTGERESLDTSPLYGVLAHIPKGGRHADLYLVDLAAGWKAARQALDVRAYRSAPNVRKLNAKFAEADAPGVEVDRVEQPATAPVEKRHPEDCRCSDCYGEPEPTPVVEPERPVPADPEAAAIALVTSKLGDAVLDAINAANSRDECVALWHEHMAAGTWRPDHDEAVKARLAALAAA